MYPEDVLARFDDVKAAGQVKWQARCPAHDDQKASLSLTVGEDRRLLLHCHAGCTPEAVCSAAGLRMADLFAEGNLNAKGTTKTRRARRMPKGRIVATYDYRGPDGTLLYQVVRFDPKGFYQRRPAAGGGWSYSMKGARYVPYRLPELLAAKQSTVVFICEGEKDCDNLVRLGLVSTTNVGGAGKWRDEYNDHLAGRHVVVLEDNDESGRDRSDLVAGSVVDVVSEVKVLALPGLPEKGDVSDWLAAEGTAEKLLELCAAAAPWQPAETPRASDKKNRGKESNQAGRLLALAADAEFWHDGNANGYATVPVGKHREHHSVRSKTFRLWLGRHYYQASGGGAPNAQATQDALNILEGRARFDGVEHAAYVRIAELGDKIYIDLADAEWRAVEVTANGWCVVGEPLVRFRRAKGMLALPVPEPGGSISHLRTFVNIADGDWPLLLAWLVSAYRPRGPYPLLCLHGEQGSAKSTTAKVLRALIDPNSASMRAEPKDPRDLAIAANNGWLVALDNLSYLPPWLSDALCRLSTGGAFSTRTLFENDEETLFEATRPAILNGIEEVATRSDLLDRSVLITLPTIRDEDRRIETRFWQAFERERATIFGAILEALSCALRNLPTTELETPPRMADFAQWATAAEPGLGLPGGAFLRAYCGNRECVNELALEASPVAALILGLVADGEFTGTATALLDELNQRAGHTDAKRAPKGWPAGARGLSGILRRLAPNLRKAGIEVEFDREPDHGRRKIWTMRRSTDSCVRTVQTVRSAANGEACRPDWPDAAESDRTQSRTQRSTENAQPDEADTTDAKIPVPSTNGDGRVRARI